LAFFHPGLLVEDVELMTDGKKEECLFYYGFTLFMNEVHVCLRLLQ